MASGVEVARRLSLAWGLHSIEVPKIESIDEMSAFACETAIEEGFANKGGMLWSQQEHPLVCPVQPTCSKFLRCRPASEESDP